MKNLGVIFILSFILLNCNINTNTSNQPDLPANAQDTGSDNLSFFPVSSYLKGQLHEIDSLPLTPLYIKTSDAGIDSVWIKHQEIRSILQPFFDNEIKETNLLSYFKETKFKDLSINSITFTYDPIAKIPDSISLRHWDVYINPETGKVTKVYIVRKTKEKNITQQLTWDSDKWAKIVTVTDDGHNPKITEEQLTWNFN